MVDIAGVVRRGRAAADAIFTDSCLVERASGARVMDPDTGVYEHQWVPVYEGPCRIQVAQTQPAEQELGGRAFVVTDALVQLPVGPVAFFDDDRVTVTGTAYDPLLVGVVLSVTSREVKTHATMRRLHVSEVMSS